MDILGITYEGKEVDGVPHGFGTMKFANGNTYTGGFHMGKFHGQGSLHFTAGNRFEGTWRYGEKQTGNIVFDDDLKYSEENWDYCTEKDRRFQIERLQGITPGGNTKLSNNSEANNLPVGCYDVADGYYDPGTGNIHAYKTGEFLRTPNEEQVKWINEKCRISVRRLQK